MNFEINLIFLIIFLHDEKIKAKIFLSFEQKELLRWNKKHFSSFLKELLGDKNCVRPEGAPVKIVTSRINTVYSRNLEHHLMQQKGHCWYYMFLKKFLSLIFSKANRCIVQKQGAVVA